jgi:EmrB/QacA subfamily drug resistance transporter
MMLCLIVISLDNTILNVALRTIQQDLRASGADMQWAVNSYTLAFAALMFTFGLLGDRYGRRRILLSGLVVFAVGSALSAWTSSPGQLIATRTLMGVGAATLMPTTLSIITTIFPARERPRAIGLWSASVGIGIAIGPLAGGYLLEHWWWGSIFLVNVPFVLAGLVAIPLVVPDSRDPAPARVDAGGVLLSTIGAVAIVFGIIRAGDRADWTAPDVLGPLAVGALLLAAFVVIERGSDHPAFDVRLFANRSFSAASGSVALVFFALMGMAFVLSYYLQVVREASPLRAGALLLPAALGIAAGSASAAPAARRFGARMIVTGGMLLAAAGFGCSLAVGRTTATWYYESCILAVGLGVGLALSPATEVVMAQLPPDRPGAGAAMNGTLRLIGASLGVAVLGALLSGSYRHQVAGAVTVLPAGARDEAAGSIGATATVVQQVAGAARRAYAAGQLPAADAQRLKVGLTALMDRADDAFVVAMHRADLCGAVVALLGAVIALLWLPSRAATVALAEGPADAEPTAYGTVNG